MTGKANAGQTIVIYATFADDREALNGAVHLVESIRQYGGRTKDAPVWVYVPEDIDVPMPEIRQMLPSAEVRVSTSPEEARWLYYASKTYAAGMAEQEAADRGAVLVWMDWDTIILQEPVGFLLDAGTALAYRPVMHNRSGSLYDEEPSAFWRRIYDDLRVKDSDLFAMVTPGDNQRIRAYFNAGLLVVRPEKGILRKWGRDFTTLWQDTVLANMCRDNVDKRIFLHQTALVGAVLSTLKRDEMVELPESYNYPLFFHKMFEAAKEFEAMDGIVSLRYDVYFRQPDPQWAEKLTGPKEKVAWLKARLGR